MGQRVLIVEEEGFGLRLFEALLSSEGYETVKASMRADALLAVQTGRPDLIQLDIDLDDAAGLDLAASVQRHNAMASVPVIAVSSDTMRDEASGVRGRRCAGYIAKPIAMHGFLDAVRQFAQNNNGD